MRARFPESPTENCLATLRASCLGPHVVEDAVCISRIREPKPRGNTRNAQVHRAWRMVEADSNFCQEAFTSLQSWPSILNSSTSGIRLDGEGGEMSMFKDGLRWLCGPRIPSPLLLPQLGKFKSSLTSKACGFFCSLGSPPPRPRNCQKMSTDTACSDWSQASHSPPLAEHPWDSPGPDSDRMGFQICELTSPQLKTLCGSSWFFFPASHGRDTF